MNPIEKGFRILLRIAEPFDGLVPVFINFGIMIGAAEVINDKYLLMLVGMVLIDLSRAMNKIVNERLKEKEDDNSGKA